MRKLFTLIVLGFGCLGSGAQWTKYTSLTDKFEVSFPNKQVPRLGKSVISGNLTVYYRTYTAQAGDVKCIVAACEIPKDMGLPESGRFTLAISEGFRANLGTENMRRAPMTIDNLRGEYVSSSDQRTQVAVWIAKYQGHVYVLSYQAPKDQSLSIENSFFSSFQAIPPPKKL